MYSESEWKSTNVKEVKPIYSENSEMVDGRVVVRNNFDKIFEKISRNIGFGEDAGNIGDVNQGLEGLQEKYGKVRVADTGIREANFGQGIGMSMRGLRPIAEIQYLDYILYVYKELVMIWQRFITEQKVDKKHQLSSELVVID